MNRLRTLPTRQLLALIAGVVVLAVGGAAAAVAAKGAGGVPLPKPLAQALHDALVGTKPTAISARIDFTNGLLPNGSLLGQATTPLESGASGRLWIDGSGGRIELQSAEGGGDVQIVWNHRDVTLFDASSNTAYVFPKTAEKAAPATQTASVPTVADITKSLQTLAQDWTISGAQPSNVGRHEAYTVDVSPRQDGGLLGKVELAWDAANGVPLEIEVYAKGQSQSVLGLKASDISYGGVSPSDVRWSPPADANVVQVPVGALGGTGSKGSSVTGLANVQAQAGFPVAAPSTLGGLALANARLSIHGDRRTAVLVYGQGLGAILVVERKADAGGASAGGMLGSLPTVTVGAAKAHELATPLGTILTWDGDGVSYVLAGSVTADAAQNAASALK